MGDTLRSVLSPDRRSQKEKNLNDGPPHHIVTSASQHFHLECTHFVQTGLRNSLEFPTSCHIAQTLSIAPPTSGTSLLTEFKHVHKWQLEEAYIPQMLGTSCLRHDQEGLDSPPNMVLVAAMTLGRFVRAPDQPDLFSVFPTLHTFLLS